MDVRAYVRDHSGEFSAALSEWLAIPSVSADPAHHRDVRRSAEWIAAHLRSAGFPVVEIWDPPAAGDAGAPGSPGPGGLPAVFAEWPAAGSGAPAVLIYGHHDVQPAEPLGEWDCDPFQPDRRGDHLFARGASDDKGQMLFHALGVRACLNGGEAPPVTLKLLIEGEEEVRSPGFAGLLRQRRDRLGCDMVVVTDTTMWAADVPSMCTGMRGVTDAEISCDGPEADLHSGSFGGAVPNPLHALAALLAGLHDEAGRVTLPGFYDRVLPLSGQERDLMARLPFNEAEWLATAGGSRAAAGEQGYSTLERVWARPTAEINGMWGGHTGTGPKTIIPRAAHAKVSFRLVADQEPADVQQALREYLAANTPAGIRTRVEFSGPGVRPCSSPVGSTAVAAARGAMARAFGREVLFTREGGSGPEADLAEILGAPLVFLAVGLRSDAIHAPNERVQISRLLKGAEAAAYLWQDLAGHQPGDLAATPGR